MPLQLKRPAEGFGRFSPETGLRLAEVLAVVLLAVVTARLVWTIVTPVTPLGAWTPVAVVAPADAGVLGSFDPFFRQRVDAPAAVSSLALTLVGTRVDTVSGRGSAIIGTPDGVQSSYLVGEEVVPGVILKSVGFDNVGLDRGGAAEMLFLDQSSGSVPVTPDGAPPAPASALPPPRLANEIEVTPRLRGSSISGYVLAPKGSGTAFAAAGLLPGDVLLAIDGTPVGEIRDPASLTQRLDTGGVGVAVERGGAVVNLRIGAPR